MEYHKYVKIGICGMAAGTVNGLIGAGGGMILVPLLLRFVKLDEEAVFPASVCMMMPICLASLIAYGLPEEALWMRSLPYLLGGAAGGILAWKFGKKIPVKWLHRGFGLLILWGGVQRLWNY